MLCIGLCIGMCEISVVAVVAAASAAIASLLTIHQHIFLRLTHHTPHTTHRRLLELLESRAASADARLLSIRQKKHPLETDYNPVKTKAMKLIFPPPALCTDNGVMVAWAGIEKLQLGISDSIEGQVMMSFDYLMLLLAVVLFLFSKPLHSFFFTLPPSLSLTLPRTIPLT